jgi:transposase
MTLEELKAAWEDASSKLAADKENKDLQKAEADAKKAYEDAKAAAEAGSEDDPEDSSKWDDETKTYIKKLRSENASHRTKNKELNSQLKAEKTRKKEILKAAGIEEESENPEEKIQSLSTNNQQLAYRAAILESAIEHGISKDDVDYYEFLVSKAMSELADEEELPVEKLKEIVGKVKKKSRGNTSVDGKGDEPPPGDGGKGTVTLEQFAKMSITEKSQLYVKNSDLYSKLFAEAKAKKMLL